jgi:hypothetical protein
VLRIRIKKIRKLTMGLGLGFKGMGKKAQSFGFFEIILVVAVIFIVGVAWLVTNSVGFEVNSLLLDDSDFLTTNESRAVLEDTNTRLSTFLDSGFILLVFGLFLIGGVSAWFSGSSPVFFVVTVLFMVMVLVFPVLLGDTWGEIGDEFVEGEGLPFMDWVLNNHLLFSIVFVFFCLGVMFSRARWDS